MDTGFLIDELQSIASWEVQHYKWENEKERERERDKEIERDGMAMVENT